ncbi:MAG: YihY/virulence factor BrkB family protein [Caldilineaceae bacterium]
MFREIYALLKKTVEEWREDRASQLAAALAYYTIFSLAPLLIIAIAVAAFFLADRSAVHDQLLAQVRGLIGQGGAELIGAMLENSSQDHSGLIASLIGLATLLLGATGAFSQLQSALNQVWDVEAKSEGVSGIVKVRALSFAMVLVIGFLLLVSLVVSTALSAIDAYLLSGLPGGELLVRMFSLALSFGLITLLFALIYKVLPDAEIQWRDVWIGAAFTALLFTIGKYLIGLYLGNSSVSSTYGAAGSLVVLLLWIYYSAQILLFGAEFTQVYARRHGARIRPSQHAISVTRSTEGA